MAIHVSEVHFTVEPIERGFRLCGEFDLAAVELFEAAVEGVGAGIVVLDMSAVSFIDSSGIHAIVGLHRRLTSVGGRLRVEGASSHIVTVFGQTGLARMFGVEVD
jgi:anti-anti-sigma factor